MRHPTNAVALLLVFLIERLWAALSSAKLRRAIRRRRQAEGHFGVSSGVTCP